MENVPHDGSPALRCVVAYNTYGAYCVPESSRHRPAAQAILRGGVWESETVALLRERCGTGDVVHAGTYFGDFLPGISGALAPGALLWAFEPSRENYRCARITVELNALGNVRLEHGALSDRTGVGSIATTDRNGRALGGMSRLLPGHAPGAGVEAVPLATVDACVPSDRRVSVLQLDVEGHEEAALRGAIATIDRCRPLIVVEINAGSSLPTSAWFREEIVGRGYRPVGSVCGNAVFEVGSAG